MSAVCDVCKLEALDERFQDLKSLLANAFEERDLCPFFRILCEEIVPNLLSHPYLEACRREWMHEREEYAKRHRQYEKRAIAEIKNSFKILWSRYRTIQKHDSRLIDLFASIERVLEEQENEEPYVIPHAYEVAHDRLKELCIALYEQGHDAVVSGMIEVQAEARGRFLPVKFLLAPSLEKLRSLWKAWNWDSPATWVIWEYLYAACWAWKTPHKFFLNANRCMLIDLLNAGTVYVFWNYMIHGRNYTIFEEKN
jgi:hypothetical protein